MSSRRQTLVALTALPALGLLGAPQRQAQASAPREAVAALLREGGVVIALRHARAPGTFDPPGFELGRCETQRNLDEEGRAQVRSLGQWFRGAGLAPAAVRSSPWCRCLETARGTFGTTQTWAALGSPHALSAEGRQAQLAELRRALAAASRQRGRFEAWVTHNFVLRELSGVGIDEAEALVLRAGAADAVQVLARVVLH